LLLERSAPEKALKTFRRATRLDRYDWSAWAGVGKSLRKLKRYSGAVAAYKRALIFRPNEPPLLVEFGELLEEMKRYPEAITHGQHALKLDPKNVRAATLVSDCQREIREHGSVAGMGKGS